MKLLAERGGKSVVTGEVGRGGVVSPPPPALDSRHEKLSEDELNVTPKARVFERTRVSSVVQSGGDKGDMMAEGSGGGGGGSSGCNQSVNQPLSLRSLLFFSLVTEAARPVPARLSWALMEHRGEICTFIFQTPR